MAPYTLVTLDDSATRTYAGLWRNFTSPDRPISRIPVLPQVSSRRIQTLFSRQIVPPNTNDLTRPLIRTIRYEDTVEEARRNDNLRTSPPLTPVHGSRDDHIGMKDEVRSQIGLPYIPESFETVLLPQLGNITPKKGLPTFTAKQQSISEPFNSARRAGTRFVRRGIQWVAPTTPSKKFNQRLSNISYAPKEIRDDMDECVVRFETLNLQSKDDLDDVTPGSYDVALSMALIEESLATHSSEDSTDTERTFYDAQESLTPAISISTPSLATTAHMAEDVMKIDEEPQTQCSTRPSLRPVGMLTQEYYSSRVLRPVDIVTSISQGQSTATIPEDVSYAALSGCRASRLSFVSCAELKEVDPCDVLDPETKDADPSIWHDNEPQSTVTVDNVQNISKVSEIAEQVSTQEIEEGLFDLIKGHLRQPITDIPARDIKPLEVVRVTTKGHHFRNAHKNYFPVWAAGVNERGRHYTQEETVDKIMKVV